MALRGNSIRRLVNRPIVAPGLSAVVLQDLAGVEVALHLRRRMHALETLAERLMRQLLEEAGSPNRR